MEIIKLTPYPLSSQERGGEHCSPSLREEKVRIAMPRLCEAFGDAIPLQRGVGG